MVPRLCGATFVASIVLALGSADAQDRQSRSAGSEPDYVLVTTSAKRVHDHLTFEFVAPKVMAREWVVYTTRLPELAAQTKVRSALFPGGRHARELSAAGRPVLVARIPVKGSRGRDGVTVRVEYEANLFARRLVRREPGAKAAPPVAPLSQKERRFALASGHQFDFPSPSFQGWLDAHKLRRDSAEGETDFARRVFLQIKGTFQHFENPELDRVASRVCKAARSDSGGLSIVFASALRANGIPAHLERPLGAQFRARP